MDVKQTKAMKEDIGFNLSTAVGGDTIREVLKSASRTKLPKRQSEFETIQGLYG